MPRCAYVYTNCYWTVHLKMVNFILYEFHLYLKREKQSHITVLKWRRPCLKQLPHWWERDIWTSGMTEKCGFWCGASGTLLGYLGRKGFLEEGPPKENKRAIPGCKERWGACLPHSGDKDTVRAVERQTDSKLTHVTVPTVTRSDHKQSNKSVTYHT